MTVTASPLTLTTVERYQTFSDTITLSSTGEIITSVNFVKNFTDPEILLTNSTSTLTVSGKHTTAFNSDEVIFVEKGSSDKIETPSVANSFSTVPPKKDLIEINQDPSESKTRTYTATVIHSNGTSIFTFTQTVDNDVTSAMNFIEEYLNASSN